MKLKLLALTSALILVFTITGCTTKTPGTTATPKATVTVTPAPTVTVSPKPTTTVTVAPTVSPKTT